MSAPSCLFCHPDDARLNSIAGQHGTVYARWDNYPASKGHLEIVPLRHVESYFDLTTREVHDMHQLACAMKDLLERMYRPDGYTLGINDGQAAGRSVHHLHQHIIPRWHGDVPDPRGGIRQIFANCDPDAWR
ncbi:HIT domain-containing protein [Nocardia sp. NPDC052566]|uniref:HIT domain-containing protein n=1 Tax=Nocardia sp. NPDC052566 TaxID=3364330 RepID=UPI0037C80B66